ncbi:MlaD family protein [Verrucomicrobia bacterium]|nr:MlaD family protein [Verrucomicrobiota bacterium]
MRNSIETRVGAFFALAVVATFILFELIGGGGGAIKGGNSIHALFGNVKELKVGDQVKMAGVEIGTVTGIGFEDSKVRVSMSIEPDVPVKTDSAASIQFKGMLGRNFVAIGFGSDDSPVLDSGASITTREQADLSVIMEKLDNVAAGMERVTGSFSGDSISNIMGPLADFMKVNNPKITTFLSNMEQLSTLMAAGEGSVGKMLTDESLYNGATNAVHRLTKTTGELEITLAEARTIFDTAKNALGMAESSLSEVQATLKEARKIVIAVGEGEGTLGKLAKDEALYKEAVLAMNNLKEVLEKMNEGEGTVGKLINDDSLFDNAKVTLQKVDKATDSLEDTGPLSVIGTTVKSLF